MSLYEIARTYQHNDTLRAEIIITSYMSYEVFASQDTQGGESELCDVPHAGTRYE